jgi:phosphodiesterase/alkaline phosphatase D-like protein
MKRTTKLLVVVVALAATVTGVAIAASSPTVSTGTATKVGNASATLQAKVNPNGNQTRYSFEYGATNAYGLSSTSHAAGNGTKAVSVATAVSGLTPGTVYHYRVDALNKAGTTFGSDRTFTTTGHPPAAVVTGSPLNVRKTFATVTGSVNPNGEATTWSVQYGLTTNYGVLTFGQSLASVTTPLPVSARLSGLAPATLFHYRIVAFHGASVISAGADQTFFTEPDIRPQPRVTTQTKPSRDRTKPYVFTTGGTLHGAGFIPATVRCAGSVGIRYYVNGHQIGFIVVPVGPNCKFSGQHTFRRLSGHGSRAVRVLITFRGNGYLAPAVRTDHVTAR